MKFTHPFWPDVKRERKEIQLTNQEIKDHCKLFVFKLAILYLLVFTLDNGTKYISGNWGI